MCKKTVLRQYDLLGKNIKNELGSYFELEIATVHYIYFYLLE